MLGEALFREHPDYDSEREVFGRRLGEVSQLGLGDDEDALYGIQHPLPEMRFRLTFDGSLPATGRRPGHRREKWDIRRQLHSQLFEYWTVHHMLSRLVAGYTDRAAWEKVHPPGTGSPETAWLDGSPAISKWGYSFVPLIRESLDLACSLDILFLRKSRPGAVVTHGGDLDNRIKVLFDGLRLPQERHEMLSADEKREHGEIPNPCFCLLEDDKLITSFAVRSDRLLTAPNASLDQVRLILDVIVIPTQMSYNALKLLGG